jgi:hypothetical protein
MSLPTKFLSFNEIVEGRESTVRVTDDGFIIAVDLVMVVTGQNRDHAGKTLRTIPEETFPSEKISERKMPGIGNAKTKLVTLKDAVELVMVLPGKVAKETRTKFANIITRYMAGDESLIHEVQANAESTSPIAQLARASLDEDKAYKLTHKRKLYELEIEERMVAIERAKKEIQAMHADTMAKNADTMAKNTDTMAKTAALYTSLCPNQEIDERGRLLLKDSVLNSAMNGKLITNGAGGAGDSGAPAKDPNKFITISTVASELGYRFDTAVLIKIGRDVKHEYENRHHEEPPKHEQFVNGGVRQVCSYQERDRDLVEAVIKRYAGAAKKA